MGRIVDATRSGFALSAAGESANTEAESTLTMSFKTACMVLLLASLSLVDARAEGAVAIAEPQDVAAQGYAFGLSGDFGTEQEARAGALERCRSEPNAPEETKALCRIVYVYRDGCVSGALDPEPGTPGAGWGAGSTKGEAEEVALAACRNTSMPDRKPFCTIIATQCDGRGNG